ncbi:MAG: CPBP family intramembrane metalloprotease [Cyclobacteriaceae bacterium]|nr:CPBP family intramembrane metalloprotease [Cyclobacteriaceae bacterium]
MKEKLKGALAGMGAPGILFALVTLFITVLLQPLGAAIVLWWRNFCKVPFREIGFRRPPNIFIMIGGGILAGVALKLFTKAVVMRLLGDDSLINVHFQYLYQNPTAALQFVFLIVFFAGFCEEIVFRGFLFQRLIKVLGNSTTSLVFVVIISSVLFGIPHLRQEFYGIVHATIVGLTFGTLYLVSKKNLWLLIVTHSFYDLFSLLLIYNGWERQVSTLIFQ